jgi:hypothetical protein
MSNYVWCDYESVCDDLVSASAIDSGSDSATMASAVIVSTVAKIQGLQQYSSEAEPRTQDQVTRSNAQTVTLPMLTHSYFRHACVNVVWIRSIISAHNSAFGAAIEGQTKGRSRISRDSNVVDIDGQEWKVGRVSCYEWKSENALVDLTFQVPLKSLNYRRRRRHVLKYTKYN